MDTLTETLMNLTDRPSVHGALPVLLSVAIESEIGITGCENKEKALRMGFMQRYSRS
jgi:hypothetical protein